MMFIQRLYWADLGWRARLRLTLVNSKPSLVWNRWRFRQFHAGGMVYILTGWDEPDAQWQMTAFTSRGGLR